MKKIFWLVLIICQLSIANCQLLEKNADAVYQYIKHEYILNQDGSTIYNYEHKLKLLTSFAINRSYGETFVVYNPQWQSLKINKAVTTMADGKEVSVPQNAFNEVLPGFAAQAVPYMHLREMVITHTGLERNCTVDLSYSIASKAGFLPGLIGKITVGDRSPIKNIDIIIKIPSGKKLNFTFANTNIQPNKTSENNFDIYTWHFENLPLIAQEDAQPDLADFNPTLIFGTATSEEIQKHILGNEKGLYDLNDKAKAIVMDIIKDKYSLEEKSLAIKNWIETSVGLMNCDLSYIGYKPLPAQEVFDRNVGSTLDRAVLLIAILKAVDIPSTIVLAPNSFCHYEPCKDSESKLELLSQFSIPYVKILKLSDDKGLLYLDPNEHQKNQYPSRIMYKTLVNLNTKATEPYIQTPNENAFKLNIGLDSLGYLYGSSAISLSGAYIPATDKSGFEAVIISSLNANGYKATAKNNDLLINTSGVIPRQYDIKSNNPVENISGVNRIKLPNSPCGLNELHIPISTAPRSTPVILPFIINDNVEYSITIPAGKTISSQSFSVSKKNDIGEVKISSRFESGILKINKTIKLEQLLIPSESYKQFYELLSEWYDKKYSVIFFE
jgi:hypothetical protein